MILPRAISKLHSLLGMGIFYQFLAFRKWREKPLWGPIAPKWKRNLKILSGGSRYTDKVQLASSGTHELSFMKPRGRSDGCLPYSTPSIDALSIYHGKWSDSEKQQTHYESVERSAYLPPQYCGNLYSSTVQMCFPKWIDIKRSQNITDYVYNFTARDWNASAIKVDLFGLMM